MTATAIEWATDVWNPVTGCDRVSPGCAHCYALEYAGRLKAMGQPKYQRDGGSASGPGFGVTLHEDVLVHPLRWRKPRRVFVNSMSDLFHPEVPDSFIARVFNVMELAPQHQFLVLTKRPERMRDLLTKWATPIDPATCCDSCAVCWHDYSSHFPVPNVWLGVTIENRRFVDRADILRDTPAAVRFISAEPLLGPLIPPRRSREVTDAFGAQHTIEEQSYEDTGLGTPYLDLSGIDWLIVGGESGHQHRRFDPQWARDLRDLCLAQEATTAAGFTFARPRTAFFFKQHGGRTPKAGGRELDGRTWDELPVAAEARA